ncbi:protein sym1 [Lactarius tabidus]
MSSIALARAYRQSFEAHPHCTLAIAGGALTALGDAVAQLSQYITISSNDGKAGFHYDIPRTLRFFCFGAGISPVIGRWYRFLELKFPLPTHGGKVTSLTALSKRVAVDQLVMAPIGLSIFIGSMGMMECRDAQHIRARFQDIYQPALLANWKIWPAAQFINFRFMPLPYRVPFQQTCGVFWTLYLSLLNSAESEKQDAEDSSLHIGQRP